MKPLTVFHIVVCALGMPFNIWAYSRNHEPISLWIAGVLALCLAFWIWEACKENRNRRDMQNLVNDLAKQLANGTSAKPCETKYKGEGNR